MTDNEVCLRWNAFKNNLMTSLESLWNEDEYVDVTLMCGGQQVRSHQVVLSASSPFFNEIFKVSAMFIYLLLLLIFHNRVDIF